MIGVVVLVLALLVCLPLLARWAANADPRVLLRVLRLAAVLVMGAAVLLLLVFGRGLVLGLLAPLLFGLFMQWRRARNMAKTARGPTPGKGSEVQTRFLSMRLDHDSGAMHGRVIDGPHTGAGLSDLAETSCSTSCASTPATTRARPSFWKAGWIARDRRAGATGPRMRRRPRAARA